MDIIRRKIKNQIEIIDDEPDSEKKIKFKQIELSR